MSSPTQADLARLFPKASPDFLRLNGQAAEAPADSDRLRQAPATTAVTQRPADVPAGSAPPPAKPKRRARPRTLAAGKAQGSDPAFYVVRVTSFRSRLLDTDNLVPKWHVDALRYAGILPEDAPDRARIETGQEKVATKAEERTEIEILKLPCKP